MTRGDSCSCKLHKKRRCLMMIQKTQMQMMILEVMQKIVILAIQKTHHAYVSSYIVFFGFGVLNNGVSDLLLISVWS